MILLFQGDDNEGKEKDSGWDIFGFLKNYVMLGSKRRGWALCTSLEDKDEEIGNIYPFTFNLGHN